MYVQMCERRCGGAWKPVLTAGFASQVQRSHSPPSKAGNRSPSGYQQCSAEERRESDEYLE